MLFDEHLKDVLIRLIVSLVVGLIIGAEREFRNKSAGLRTMILICLGSTVFTIVSFQASHESEVGRIASNIVTGIGFLGAGAIMRDGLSVSGLTTASTIWMVAALGMAIGVGDFQLTIIGTVLVMIVLVLFNYIQKVLDSLHKTLNLHVIFPATQDGIREFESRMRELQIHFERLKEKREEGDVKYQYAIAGNAKKLDLLIQYLIEQKQKVKSFEY
ncbi:MAG TPA: MgtC/SapB family protein [Chryseosolibacter sp.]|nr:MgtC/SapB family protein [Chryseosolibacter sp.]